MEKIPSFLVLGVVYFLIDILKGEPRLKGKRLPNVIFGEGREGKDRENEEPYRPRRPRF